MEIAALVRSSHGTRELLCGTSIRDEHARIIEILHCTGTACVLDTFRKGYYMYLLSHTR